MKKTITILFFFIMTKFGITCDYLKVKDSDISPLMGKKSKIYDGYKQGKCVLDNALRPLPAEQREVIVKLIAKTFKSNNN